MEMVWQRRKRGGNERNGAGGGKRKMTYREGGGISDLGRRTWKWGCRGMGRRMPIEGRRPAEGRRGVVRTSNASARLYVLLVVSHPPPPESGKKGFRSLY